MVEKERMGLVMKNREGNKGLKAGEANKAENLGSAANNAIIGTEVTHITEGNYA